MSLYKTQRCRHFDEAGNPIKPYCSQGNKCRRVLSIEFIHPNDHQWVKLKRRVDETPSPEHRDAARSKGKHKAQLSPRSRSPPRQRSSPLVPQSDLFKRKQKDAPREHDSRDWSLRNGDRRRDSDSWDYPRERNGPYDQSYSLKRPNDEGDPYPNQRQRLSERSVHGSAHEGGSNDARHATQPDKNARPPQHNPERDLKVSTRVSDTFHRLARLCCEIVQDTCFLDREEDKLKAFTGLSSELSRSVPDSAMAVTPALATVINDHARTRERLENHVEELESLWKTLFSILEADISKVIDSRLEQAMSSLHKERDNILRMISRSQRPIGDRTYDGAAAPRQRTAEGGRETASDRTTSSSGRITAPLNGGPSVNATSEEKGVCHHTSSTAAPLVPTREADLGASLRTVLEDMKMQMDRQTRAIELLAKENLQLKSATEQVTPPLVPPASGSSSPRKPSIV